MTSKPVFQLQPSYSLPRLDRLIKARRARSEPGTDDQQNLDQILPAYGLKPFGQASSLGAGGRSNVLVVNTEIGLKMLKRYKANVVAEAVLHEHEILRFLAKVDFLAPRLIPALDGQTIVRLDGRIFALFDYLEGYFHYNNYLFLPSQTRQFVASAGQTLGSLHELTRNFSPEGTNPNGFLSHSGQRVRELDWFTSKLAGCLDQAPRLVKEGDSQAAAMIINNRAWVEESLRLLDDRLKSANLTQVVIHGDYGPYNLLFKRGAPVVVIDFELARLDWPLIDLTKAMSTFARNRFGFSQNKAATFLNAYRTSFEIDDAELAYLPEVWEFLTLRRLIVCWHRYCQNGKAIWAKEAQEKLKKARWIESNKALLPLG
jgi:homoserine kinase type II